MIGSKQLMVVISLNKTLLDCNFQHTSLAFKKSKSSFWQCNWKMYNIVQRFLDVKWNLFGIFTNYLW